MGNESGYENISMFDKQEEFSANVSQKLEVVKLNYDHVERMTWEELFTGYDTLKAITFSSGINFVYRLLNMFASAVKNVGFRRNLIICDTLSYERCNI